ncbi:hypothetical protein [Methylobacterium sp. 10]|uniref:hypothetical protein n=1 Tax=Methylobacterium sp. 10 TaxID=1101191 RepID=UPI00048A2D9A|nr:hypothetical protein [Methylobacterium sp. 10]
MKMLMSAAIIVSAMITAADAAEMPVTNTINSVNDTSSVSDLITKVAWVGRYGQLCSHGPVWMASCHGSDRPGPYIQGHWNPMRTRWIPGHYV